eukprot:scaffold2572_cov391-Prasinococcus_capsulatus_cf.AAC.5
MVAAMRANLSVSRSSFSGTSLRTSARAPVARSSSRRCVAMAMPKDVLVVNTNSGGHAVIGYSLCKRLAADGHRVTFNIVGEQGSDKMRKEPFASLYDLYECGVEVCWADPADVPRVHAGKRFHIVVDNNGKDLENVKPVADFADQARAEQFLYVSSAGIYKKTDLPPHFEGDEVNPKASHVAVEEYLATLYPAASYFRPQYITGTKKNKDCEEYFFDRIVRNRPILIPGSGMQMTNIAHHEDLASMIAAAVGNYGAKDTIFNCVNDRGITLEGMAKICAKIAGREANIVFYDPSKLDIDGIKKAFPFRNQHFYSYPANAREILAWRPSHKLEEDLAEMYMEYARSSRMSKDLEGAGKFKLDDAILAALEPARVSAW